MYIIYLMICTYCLLHLFIFDTEYLMLVCTAADYITVISIHKLCSQIGQLLSY